MPIKEHWRVRGKLKNLPLGARLFGGSTHRVDGVADELRSQVFEFRSQGLVTQMVKRDPAVRLMSRCELGSPVAGQGKPLLERD